MPSQCSELESSRVGTGMGLVTRFDQVLWSVSQVVRATEFGEILRRARRSSESSGGLAELVGWGIPDALQMWELSFDPAVQRTLAAVMTMHMLNRPVPAESRDWVEWITHAHEAVQRMAANCWSGVSPNIRKAFLDTDDLLPPAMRGEIAELRRTIRGQSALTFAGLDAPQVQRALGRLFAEVRESRSAGEARDAASTIQRLKLVTVLADVRAKVEPHIRTINAGETGGQGMARTRQTVMAAYDANPQLATLVSTLRSHNRFVTRILWTLLGAAEQVEPTVINDTVGPTEEQWERVQDVLDEHFGSRQRRSRHAFAYSGFITCGHCGCSLVAERQKGRYVYYHCTGYKQRCPERYAREELVESQFIDLLSTLALDSDVVTFVRDSLRESHEDERRFHDEAVANLQGEYQRLQNRIDTMYLDKLDGRVDARFYDGKSTEWRKEQKAILRDIQRHQQANTNYLDEGLRILDIACRAEKLFREQDHQERRDLLGFVLADASWKDGKLHGSFRLPFSLIADANARTAKLRRVHRPRRVQSSKVGAQDGDVTKVLSNSSSGPISNTESGEKGLSEAEIEIWRPIVDALRTFVFAGAR